MENQYFNSLETDKIFKLKETNPEKALLMYKEYFKKYPKDYSTYCYYIEQLLVLGRVNEAEKNIEKVYSLIKKDSAYQSRQKEKRNIFDKNICYAKLRLLLIRGEYKKALEFKKDHEAELKDRNIDAIDILCKKNMGILNMDRSSATSYIFKQMVEYSEIDFLEHIKKRYRENEDDNKIDSFFMPNFPLMDVLNEIKKYIPSDKAMYPGFGDTSYYFRFDNCGRYGKKVENYFKVVCIQGTSNIITIYPIPYGEDVPHVDLNYMQAPVNYGDSNRPSRIDRFNARFNRKPSN